MNGGARAVRTIGILGGGQLGRMLALEAKSMGLQVIVLDPQPNSPCGQVADDQIVAAYDDLNAVSELGERSDVVTYEFENIPLDSVVALEVQARVVRPNSKTLEFTQHRVREKQFVRDCGAMTADFMAIEGEGDLEDAIVTIGFPALIKSARGGYDGKGQWLVKSAVEARAAYADAKSRDLIYEAFVPFDLEASVIAVRGSDGTIVTFPVAENQHDRGVLATSIVPARISATVAAKAQAMAMKIAAELEIVGAFCVEYFVRGDDVLVNEIAPRVHNSGHYSLDATQISQYEAHVRAICDLPLVVPHMFAPAVMKNILGTGTGDVLGGIDALLRDPDTKLHMYGKEHAAMRRKMGHFTVLGTTIDDALARADAGTRVLAWRES